MSYNYNPIPPRVWSRVQNPCTYIVPDSSYNSAYIPLTGQTVSQAQADYEMQLFRKGNILQYKGNSSRLTKKQKYTQLAKGFGPNRTKVFATQSQTYTNPNTTGLLRVNFDSYPYPNQIVGAPNNISGPFQYNVPNPFDCSSNTIQDGGTLVCGTYANPCTGEIIQTGSTSATICNPASASNVPGSSILCWNNNIQTWFPRQRYIMNNSGTKWPVNYKGFVSAVTPDAPLLTIDASTNESVTLSWIVNSNTCIPISNFNIYQNGILIATVPYQINSYTINNIQNNVSFYVIAVSNNIESLPSNIVSFKVLFSATGNYTIYDNNGFTGIIFDYQSGFQSLTLYEPQIVTLIVIGGGGGGTSGSYISSGSFIGSSVGGAGGGVTYFQNFYLNTGTYTINVGSGGQGINGTNAPGNTGGNSNFAGYISYGGSGGGQNSTNYSFGGSTNTSYGGGGGMGGLSKYSINGIFPFNNISGTNSISGNQGSIVTTVSNGASSFYAYNSIPIFVPFINLNSTITVGGGGGAGSGVSGGPGGGSGKGQGGVQPASSINGENGYNSILNGYGGGGGGGGLVFPNPYGNGGNGGNGAVIVYWPPYNTSYINTNNFMGNYVIYNNNGYIGYVFNYGLGSITFNKNINNVTLILCGGGGAGSDGIQNPNVNAGGGGGGGGTYYASSLNFISGQTYNLSVGYGGTYYIPTGSGSNTIFGSYTAGGGIGSDPVTCAGGNGGNGGGLGGGGGGGGGGYTSAGPAAGGSGGTGGSGNGDIGMSSGLGSAGGNSYLYNSNNSGIQMPFLPGQPSIQFGGGGQSADDSIGQTNGGASGLGIGGSGDTNQFVFGGNGINNINLGFGGGGGGGGSNIGTPTGANGGSGGNGVAILYWQI